MKNLILLYVYIHSRMTFGHFTTVQVYRATEKSCGGRKTAVKYMDLNGYGERPIYAQREIEALHMLEGHPHVIQLYDVCENVGYCC